MDKPINIFASSFNCAKLFPFEDDVAQNKILEQLIPQIANHDVYLLGFQELVSIWQGSFSYVCERYLQALSELVLERINKEDCSYKCVNYSCLGAVGLIVLCKEELEVTNVLTANVKCGAFYSSLKGATSIRFKLHHADVEDTITCVSAHLAANEGPINLEKRIADYFTIMGSLRNEFGEMEFSHVVFTGDLNFRLTERFEDVDYKDPDVIAKLLEGHDELLHVMKTEQAFAQFFEPTIQFPPTFKYNLPTANEENLFYPLTYQLKRQPSWCDRILCSKISQPTKVRLYKAIPRTQNFYFTDHQPVILSIEVPHIEQDTTNQLPSSSRSVTPSSSSSSLSLSFGRVVDLVLGYSGWLYFKHPKMVLFGISVYAIYLWMS